MPAQSGTISHQCHPQHLLKPPGVWQGYHNLQSTRGSLETFFCLGHNKMPLSRKEGRKPGAVRVAQPQLHQLLSGCSIAAGKLRMLQQLHTTQEMHTQLQWIHASIFNKRQANLELSLVPWPRGVGWTYLKKGSVLKLVDTSTFKEILGKDSLRALTFQQNSQFWSSRGRSALPQTTHKTLEIPGSARPWQRAWSLVCPPQPLTVHPPLAAPSGDVRQEKKPNWGTRTMYSTSCRADLGTRERRIKPGRCEAFWASIPWQPPACPLHPTGKGLGKQRVQKLIFNKTPQKHPNQAFQLLL